MFNVTYENNEQYMLQKLTLRKDKNGFNVVDEWFSFMPRIQEVTFVRYFTDVIQIIFIKKRSNHLYLIDAAKFRN